jgi:hypothetical protein
MQLGIGQHATWYDSGLASDIFLVHQQAVSENAEQRALIRGLFGLPEHGNMINSHVAAGKLDFQLDAEHGEQRALVVNSVFQQGGSIGVGAVVINSIFLDETHVPPDSVVIESRINSIFYTPTFSKRLLCYGVVELVIMLSSFITDDCVYFSAMLPGVSFLNPDGALTTGLFPLAVIPKNTSTRVYLDVYNTGAKQGR